MSWEAWGEPGYLEWPECRDCEGTGIFRREAGCIDGIYYDAIEDATCGSCGGSGFTEPSYERFDDDVI